MSKYTAEEQAEHRKEWVKALRSGKYEQAKGTLKQTDGGREQFCCLGVACDISGLGETSLRKVMLRLTAKDCEEQSKHQFPDDPEPDGRIRWRIRCHMDLAKRLMLDSLNADPGRRWTPYELQQSAYCSPTWNIPENAPISMAFREMESANEIDIVKGVVYLS